MASEFTKLTMKTMIELITTAFAFVAGLAWNQAIQTALNQVFKAGGALTGLLIYAIIVTIVAVIATVLLVRTAARMGIETE